MLPQLAESCARTQITAFDSTARGDDRAGSDVDLLVQPPADADHFDMIWLEEAFETILGRDVDLVSYGGLDPRLDRDILRDKVLL
ncbi:nucleotidyltransferase [Sediminivirga luteola]|uniref:Nucleotidyltransferase n=1 Tax=Sediminivirga luteola TaxID=1774748 RepID=A0A8J2U0S7_9MICO|nr:nucleotidyltransferase [Sediminivirga luteola]